ncbi:MAG: hypothetical protein O3B90_03310 [Actinomycetota bacterium]|jgi:hypothetical protein|uniref:hypothetical protein n=1 Tax=uncultured Ilumatobacter sp. TaxID=879968 RepID=UPI00374F6E3D|nr:hypothetical protein [Actinomycetota bacterium]
MEPEINLAPLILVAVADSNLRRGAVAVEGEHRARTVVLHDTSEIPLAVGVG